MTKYKPYSTYKPSGVEWLGDVPKHWQLKRLKFVCNVNPTKAEVAYLADDTEVSFCPMELVGNGTISAEGTKLLGEVRQGFTYFRDGDIVMAKITPSFENGKGSIASNLVNGLGFGTTELHVLRPNPSIDRRFLYYLTVSGVFREVGAAHMYGVAGQKRVPNEFLTDFPTPLAPLQEQRVIANFLDRETTRIDTLITKKREMIDLLEKKRAAIVTEAVTKGCDQDVLLKNGGVEWLNEVPAHWKVARLKFLAHSIQTGPFGSQLHSDDYSPGGIPVINPLHLSNGHIYPDFDVAVDDETWHRLSRHELQEGDIVFARRGEIGRCGLVTSIEAGWLCGTGSMRLRPNQNVVLPSFIVQVLSTRGAADQLLLDSVGSTMDNLNTKTLSNLLLPVPPLSEQKSIIEYLKQQTGDLDNLLEKIEMSIDEMTKGRQALITAAVTGKIDVREEIKSDRGVA